MSWSAGRCRPTLLDGWTANPPPGRGHWRSCSIVPRTDLGDGASAEQVLWTLWSGTSWGERLRSASLRGGQAARLAHRDLDALCALFETAARSEEQRDHTSVATFLATLTAQEIPADTLAERGVRGESVRLLTAHRAKGQEWRLVVVAHVQEGSWPDLRRRDSLLGADRIAPVAQGGLLPPLTRSAMLAEERRLFYVAVTRPRQRLVVTAVKSPDDDGEQPSRFLDELGHDVHHRIGRPRRPLSVQGLVAESGAPSLTPGSRSRCARRPPPGSGCSRPPRCTVGRSRPSRTRRPGGDSAARRVRCGPCVPTIVR